MIISTMANKQCVVCGRIDTQRCGACKMAYYCSVQHQHLDWPRHSAQCLANQQQSFVIPNSGLWGFPSSSIFTPPNTNKVFHNFQYSHLGPCTPAPINTPSASRSPSTPHTSSPTNCNVHNYWECSNCGHDCRSSRNDKACAVCGVLDSDRNRIKANAFYKFGIINSPHTSLLPKDVPFFIYPMAAPKVSYYLKRERDVVWIRFHVQLFDTAGSTEYTPFITQLQLQTVNDHNAGLNQVLRPIKYGVFQVAVPQTHVNKQSYRIMVKAKIMYKIADREYQETSPSVTFAVKLRPTFNHQKELKDYLISESDYEQIKKQETQQRSDGYNRLRLVELSEDADEYHAVRAAFLESAKRVDVAELFVYRVVNQRRAEAHEYKKQEILRSLNGDKYLLNEFQLYHGSDFSSILSILHQGFLRQYANKTAYGQGTYFARDASYSCHTRYAALDEDGFQHLLLCNVICGEWTHGRHGMKTPPTKPNSKFIPYESTVDNEANPSIFVTYMDDQAKPLFLISFRCQKKR
mmetsp:Transcript_32676/g.52311  ORF Transcript_32676/g.52311 Transcript_32676/m.52311 type:complete len:520 (-) Transcript_32676:305-1864(-)